MSSTPNPDPMDFLKNMWGSMGIPLPGMVTPTLDANELEKRITDLKAVEGWLKTNLGMLQMTIQGLEMQRSTLAAVHAISQSANSADAETNPFNNPALWPWNFMQHAAAAAEGSAQGMSDTRTSKASPSGKATDSKKKTE